MPPASLFPLTRRAEVDEAAPSLSKGWDAVLHGQTAKRPNREHGVDDPIGAKSVTAPATVSGEVLSDIGHWATGKAVQSQRPAKSGDLPRNAGALPHNK